jgi:hypothetical protein
MAVLPPQILGFALSGAYPGMALLVLAGEAAGGTVGVTVVMGQEYLPRRMSLAGASRRVSLWASAVSVRRLSASSPTGAASKRP